MADQTEFDFHPIPGVPPFATLEEAKTWLHKRLRKGARCPCCSQYARVYKRSITSQMARWLIWLTVTYRAQRIAGEGEWVDVKKSPVRGGDYAKLRYWRLIQRPANLDPAVRSSGLWRPTRDAYSFVLGNLRLPKNIYVFDEHAVGKGAEMVTIIDALHERFNYQELMGDMAPFGATSPEEWYDGG
jgi:hypothetical protein